MTHTRETTDQSHVATPPRLTRTPGWDALLLAILVLAVLQITGLAEAGALPLRLNDILRHPLLGNILPPAGEIAMGDIGPRPGDPIGLTLNALSLGLLLGYLIIDLALDGQRQYRLKWIVLVGILLTALYLPTAKLILLRQQSGPASYTHDGGVIQTEAAIDYFVDGRNPYSEDYVDTPMAEWGFSQYRTALYHYPYLPWTFVFSAPFYLIGNAAGHYDQRWLYLLLMAVALALAPRLAHSRRAKLALVALLGLNPIMALDLIFGQNDAFVLSWIIISLAAWQEWRSSEKPSHSSAWLLLVSTVAFGLACASKPTAWFLAPFYAMLLVSDILEAREVTWPTLVGAMPGMLRRGWPALLTFAVLLIPYLLWDPYALYDDVWRWSSGKGETGYQIWGWGASNFVLALGWVENRFCDWPFWLTEILLALPLLLWFLRRQQRTPTLSNACWHYAMLLFAFFYASRFLNENYLGYILAFLAIGVLSDMSNSQTYLSAPISSSSSKS